MKSRRWMARLVCLICLPWLVPMFATGQEPPVPSLPEPVVVKEVPKDTESHRTIYVPFTDLNSTFENPETNVVLPYAEYRRLLNASRQIHPGGDAPAALITQAEYAVRIEGDLARITAHLKVKVLRQGWAEVPVRFGTATIGSLTSKEQVLLRGSGDGQNVLVFPQAGEYDIELQLAAQVHQSPEAREIQFDCPPVALTTVKVTVPGKDQKIELKPAGLATPVAGDQPETTQLTANVGATKSISIQWRPADSLMPAMDLLASVNNRTLVTIADGLIHTETWLTYDILRGEMEQTRVALPKSVRLLDVFADKGIANWTSAEEGENQVVTIKLPQPVKQQLQITIRAESKLDQSEFGIAGMSAEKVATGIHALDAVRESGQIAVRHSADLTVNVVQQQGLVRIENSEADPKLAGPNALLFKFYSPQIVLRLNAKPVEPRINVDHVVELIFQEEELQFIDRLVYQIDQAGLFELTFQLPQGAILDQVDCAQMKEYSVDPATQKLTVSLREKTQGQIGVLLKGHLSLAAGENAEFKLPITEPLKVDREQGRILVYTKDSIEVQAVQEGIESAQPLPIGGQGRQGDLTISSAWTFTHRPVVIPVRMARKPTRLRASVGTMINVDPELVHVTTKVVFQIDYSSLNEFRIEVPEAVSDRLQIEVEPGNTASAPIKQKSAAPAENGKVIWTIQTQRNVIGAQTFIVSYDVGSPVPAGQAPAADLEKSFQFDFIRPLGLVNAQGEVTTPLVESRGEVSLKKDSTLAISATSSGNGIEQIDVRELTLLPRDGTLAFRYFRDDKDNPVALTVKSSRFDIQDVVDTVVSRGLIEIVTSEDQSATYRCRFRVKSSERQRILVGLPQDLEVLGAFLNDREVKLEKADVPAPAGFNKSLIPFWINVARPESSEIPFLLTFQFLWNLKSGNHADLLEESLLQLPLPVIAGGNQGVVQELKVVIWMPEEDALVGDPDPFLLQKKRRPLSFLLGTPADHQTSHLDNWVTEGGRGAGGFAELPTDGRKAYVYSTLGSASEITARVWKKLWMTLLISVTFAVIGWILLATSWENKLGVLLLMAFAATLYGMFDSHGLSQGLHAARYGLGVMLGMWVLRGVFGSLQPRPTPPPRDYKSTKIPYAVIPPPGVFDHLHPESGGAS